MRSLFLWLRFLTALAFAIPCTLLFAVSAAAWIDSYRHGLSLRTDQRDKGYTLTFTSESGYIDLAIYEHDADWKTDEAEKKFDHYAISDYRSFEGQCQYYMIGFGGTWMEERGGSRYSNLVLPYWFLVANFAFFMIIEWLACRKLLRRLRRNHCPACGHELAGNTTGYCPKCGKKLLGNTRPDPVPSQAS